MRSQEPFSFSGPCQTTRHDVISTIRHDVISTIRHDVKVMIRSWVRLFGFWELACGFRLRGHRCVCMYVSGKKGKTCHYPLCAYALLRHEFMVLSWKYTLPAWASSMRSLYIRVLQSALGSFQCGGYCHDGFDFGRHEECVRAFQRHCHGHDKFFVRL